MVGRGEDDHSRFRADGPGRKPASPYRRGEASPTTSPLVHDMCGCARGCCVVGFLCGSLLERRRGIIKGHPYRGCSIAGWLGRQHQRLPRVSRLRPCRAGNISGWPSCNGEPNEQLGLRRVRRREAWPVAPTWGSPTGSRNCQSVAQSRTSAWGPGGGYVWTRGTSGQVEVKHTKNYGIYVYLTTTSQCPSGGWARLADGGVQVTFLAPKS